MDSRSISVPKTLLTALYLSWYHRFIMAASPPVERGCQRHHKKLWSCASSLVASQNDWMILDAMLGISWDSFPQVFVRQERLSKKFSGATLTSWRFHDAWGWSVSTWPRNGWIFVALVTQDIDTILQMHPKKRQIPVNRCLLWTFWTHPYFWWRPLFWSVLPPWSPSRPNVGAAAMDDSSVLFTPVVIHLTSEWISKPCFLYT